MAQTELKFSLCLLRFVLSLFAIGLFIIAAMALPGKGPGAPLLVVLGLFGAAALLAYLAVAQAPPIKRRQAAIELVCIMLVISVLTMILSPVFLSARAASVSTRCMSNTKELASMMVMYCVDHDDRFPPAIVWRTAVERPLEPLTACPAARTPWSYAMNIALSGQRVDNIPDASTQVLVFEGEAYGPNAYGGRDWLAQRHGRGFIGFADGHASRGFEETHVWSLDPVTTK